MPRGERWAANADVPVVMDTGHAFQRLLKSSIWLAWLMFALCCEFARPLTQNANTNTAISPSQEDSMMKRTLAASAGCGVVAMETGWMTSPLSSTFCDSASPQGSSPVGSESERHYRARVNQTAITLWPLGALSGPLVTYLSDTSKMRRVSPCTHSLTKIWVYWLWIALKSRL